MHTTNGSGQRYTDAQRMELRSYVSLAGEVIAKVWPMTSVIARNPLQGLEHLRFEEAVERGEQLFGGSGTLSQDAFQDAFRRGRIQAQHLEEALRALATDQEVAFGDRQVSHLDVLRAVMVAGGAGCWTGRQRTDGCAALRGRSCHGRPRDGAGTADSSQPGRGHGRSRFAGRI